MKYIGNSPKKDIHELWNELNKIASIDDLKYK